MRRSLRRLLITIIPVAALTLGSVAAGAGAASASQAAGKPGASGHDPAISRFIASVGPAAIRNQDALSRFRAWMLGQSGFATSGYIGSVDDLAHKATTLMWSGPATPFLRAVIAQGARQGIKVSVQHRKHSLRQLEGAAQATWHQAAAGQWSGLKVSGIVVVSPGYDGIIVNGTYTQVPAARRAPQVRALSATIAGVPTQVRAGVPVTLTNTRDTDYAPFNAGGYMEAANGNGCSSGFAIYYRGATHITTAQHCVDAPYYGAASSNSYGTSVATTPGSGGRVLSAPGDALAFDGPYNSVDFWKTVIGFEDLAVNDYVCTGGGNSGEHCGVKVTNLRVSFNDGITTFDAIEAYQQTSGQIANMQGDSGGPVISLASTSSGQVRAAGMIQGFFGAGMTGSACGPVFNAGPNKCSRDVEFTSMRSIVSDLGASLLTG
jgi:V8-like Glu-specific endopeptidase